MKAVIVECSNGAAVALCEDGTFKKVRNKNYSIGQEVYLKENVSNSRIMRTLSICASFAFVLLSVAGIGSYSYVTPYSYVSLDINPSIEYALNRYDKVIRVQGINDGGEQIVSSIKSDIKNQNITTALGATIRQLEKDNYISREEDNHVIISVCSNNDNKAQAIASRVDSFSREESQLCSIDTVTVSKEVKDSADSLGITPGKLALINAVAAASVDTDFDVSEWTDKTVNELESTIQEAGYSASGNSSVTTNAAVANDNLNNTSDDDTASTDHSVTVSATETDTEGNSSVTDATNTDTGVTDTTTTTDTVTDKDVSAGQTTAPSDSSVSDNNNSDSETGQNFFDENSSGTETDNETDTNADDLEMSSNNKGSSSPSDDISAPDNIVEDTNNVQSGEPLSENTNETVTNDSFTEEIFDKMDQNPQETVTSVDTETETIASAEDIQTDSVSPTDTSQE